MKKLMIVAGLLSALVAWVATPEDALGGLLFHRGAANNCCPVVECCQAPCAVTVSYVEQQVTAYKMEVRSKVVPTQVTRVVAKQVPENVKYTTYKMVTEQQKRTEIVCRQVVKEVPYVYNVTIPVVTQEKRQVTTYKQVMREVPYKYSVRVPVITQEKRQVTSYVCVPETVTRMVTVARRIPVCVVDPCTGCVRTVCQTVCENVPQTCTILKQVPQTSEVLVNVCNFKEETRQAVRQVCELQPVVSEVMVNICTTKTEQRQAVRQVCEIVRESRDVIVNVAKCVPVVQEAQVMRCIYENVAETVNVTQTWCERVPYTTTIRVPVYTPCAAPAPVMAPVSVGCCAPVSYCSPCGGGRAVHHTRCCR